MGRNQKVETMTKKVRTFNMTGKMSNLGKSVVGHKRLHIGDMRSGKVYAVLDFRVYPSQTNVNTQLNGTLTYKERAATEPQNPDFGSTSEIAWSSYNQHQGVPPGVGESLDISETSHKDDERYFAKDLHIYAVDEQGTQDINYYVKVGEFDTPADISSIVQLIQFSELLGQK